MGYVLDHLDSQEMGPASAAAASGHWRLATDAGGIAWLVLDKQGASANTLSTDVMTQLDEKLRVIEREKPKALVIRSAKKSGFVAGADIGEFRGVTDTGKINEQLTSGHAILDRLEALSCPTIAVIHGYALGGGLELALACDYRIAIDGASFGFPEVKLGLHPGLGGTFRFTELIDPLEAMTMMLTGKTAYTKRAKGLGIVDLVTEERHLQNAVLAVTAGNVAKHKQGLKGRAFGLGALRKFAAGKMRTKVQTKAPAEHYPAPYKLIDLWEKHASDRKKMQKAEISSFANLLTSHTAQNLIRVFFLSENLKNYGAGRSGIDHVHVIGAGAMGGEIAAWCAIKGKHVTLGDLENEPLARAVKAAAKLCKNMYLSAQQTRDALDRLIPDSHGYGVKNADLIIEAAPENPDLKMKIYADIEARMKQGAILATNTSSLKLEDLRKDLRNPENFAGVHFFNPVSKMQLVEIVSHDGAAAGTLDRLRAFTGEISRLPAPVRSYPGFLVNRALIPYLMEALVLMDEGVKKEVIDRAAEDFGMPLGPVELADQVGLDICLHVGENLTGKVEKELPVISDLLREKVSKKELGKKTGLGFYTWKDGRPEKSKIGDDDKVPDDLTDRLILSMLNAVVECLRNNVVENADIADGAMIFGTGFAPFRGGPVCYAKERGIDEITSRLKELSNKYGARFEPDQGWSEL